MKLSTATILLQFGAPVISRAVKEIAEATITEENFQRCQALAMNAVHDITGMIPGEFDDMLVDKLVDALKDPAIIQKYGDRLIDPVEEFIKGTANKYDDMALPFIEQFREIANIPDNDLA